MRLVKIDKSKFGALAGNSVYDFSHSPSEYIVSVYIDEPISGEMILSPLIKVTRTITQSGYRGNSHISTGGIIMSVAIIVEDIQQIDIV